MMGKEGGNYGWERPMTLSLGYKPGAHAQLARRCVAMTRAIPGKQFIVPTEALECRFAFSVSRPFGGSQVTGGE